MSHDTSTGPEPTSTAGPAPGGDEGNDGASAVDPVGGLGGRLPVAVVFFSSFTVLVLEIAAGRLLAPVIGVSLETFTGIIGTVLAGIALGNAAGGRIADRHDPKAVLGPLFVTAGALTWLAPALVTLVEPTPGADPIAIVMLTALTFFAPAAVLSAVTPLAAKLQLHDLTETGRTVGSLSAAGTVGALGGTFATGFVFVALVSTRTLIFTVAASLVVVGIALTGWRRVRAGGATTAVLVLVAAAVGGLAPDRCDHETAYSCVEIVPDPDRPSGRSVVLNGLRNSYVDLDDPTHLDFRYMRLFAAATEPLAPGPLTALHIGGAGFTYPRYLETVRPGSSSVVLEIDGGMVDVSTDELGLELTDDLQVVVGDARLTIGGLGSGRYDLVVADAYSGLTVPWHLTTRQFVAEIDRVLAPDGVVVANLIDGGRLRFVAAQTATFAEQFEHVALVAPEGGLVASGPRNYVMIASHQPIEVSGLDPAEGVVVDGGDLADLLDGARVLDDEFAPVDQLRAAR